MKKTIAGLTIAAAATIALGTNTNAQAATPTCILTVPSTVSVTSPMQKVYTHFTGCPVGQYAEWMAQPPTSPAAGIGANTTWCNYFFVTSSAIRQGLLHLGTVTFAGTLYSPQGATHLTSSATMSVRLGTKATVTATRSGHYVTLKATPSVYSTTTDRMIASSAKGTLQYYSPSHVWTTLKATTGATSYAVYASAARSYRFTVATTATAWGSTSATTIR
jgi:hypothetical protein